MRKKTFIFAVVIRATLAGNFLFRFFRGENSVPLYKTAKVIHGYIMDAESATDRVS